MADVLTCSPVPLDRFPATAAALAKSRAGLYAAIKSGLFVKPVRVGKRAVAFPRHETAAIVSARIAGATDEELRELVSRLMAARTAPDSRPA